MDQGGLDQLTDFNDPLFPALETLEGFSHLFDFNNLNDVNQNEDISTYNNSANNSVFNNPQNINDFTNLDGLEEYLLSDQFNLLTYCIEQPESNNTTKTNYSKCSSNSSDTQYESISPEQTTESYSNSPISVVFSNVEKDGVKITKELVFNFEEECRNFLDEKCNFPVESGENTEKMEIIVDKNICVDLENSSDEDDDDSDSCKMSIERFKLTEEEKEVFIKEGYKLPTHMPLIKSEEKLLKLVRRKIRNKKSAQNSRERKKKYVNGLEKRVEYCSKMNDELLRENKLLKSQNSQLITKMQNMQEYVNELFKKHKKSSTAVLFVSFLLTFCFYPISDTVSQSEVYQSKFQVIPFKGILNFYLFFQRNCYKN